LKNCSLKIFLLDIGDKKKRKSGEKQQILRVGCMSFTGDALLAFLTTKDALIEIGSFDFGKDPDDPRPQRPPRGSLTLRRGPRGARTEGERTFVVHAAKLVLRDLDTAAAMAPRKRSVKLSLKEAGPEDFNVKAQAGDALAAASAADDATSGSYTDANAAEDLHEYAYFINAYFNELLIGTSPECVTDEGMDPYWQDAWFQLPVNGMPLKECTLKLDLMMYKVIPASGEHESSVGGDSGSMKKGASSFMAGNDMLKPGEGLPYVLATLVLSGNSLKAVIGSKLMTKSEKDLEPTPAPDLKKSKKEVKVKHSASPEPEPLKTHQLASGVLQIGCPGSASSSPLDLLKTEGKLLAGKYDAYVEVLDAGLGDDDEEEEMDKSTEVKDVEGEKLDSGEGDKAEGVPSEGGGAAGGGVGLKDSELSVDAAWGAAGADAMVEAGRGGEGNQPSAEGAVQQETKADTADTPPAAVVSADVKDGGSTIGSEQKTE
jgi:hypothetical protein